MLVILFVGFISSERLPHPVHLSKQCRDGEFCISSPLWKRREKRGHTQLQKGRRMKKAINMFLKQEGGDGLPPSGWNSWRRRL